MGHGLPRSSRYRSDRMVRGCPQGRQILRRFYLLGETLDGMRVFGVVRSVSSLRAVRGMGKVPLWMQANRQMAANLLYASLVPEVARLDLHDLPESHRET